MTNPPRIRQMRTFYISYALLSILLLFGVGPISAKNVDDLTLEQFFHIVAKRGDWEYSKLEPLVAKLHSNWFDDVPSLRAIDTAMWSDMGFPGRVVLVIEALLKDNDPCGKDFCKHGGESNSDCTLCTNCSMGWNGTHCDKWVGGETDALLKGLQVIIDSSIAHQKNISHVNPLPGQIGVGCDLTTGHLLLPVVELTYNNANRTWTNLFGDTWRIPDQSTFEPLPTGFDIPEQTEQIFETISDYVHETFSTSEDKESHGGIYTSMADIQSINKEFFTADQGMSVIHEGYPVYKLTLPVDPATKDRKYNLDRFASQAIDFLPPSYTTDQDKARYQRFIKYFGTSFTWKARNGGIVEMISVFELDLLYDAIIHKSGKVFTKDQILQQVVLDFNKQRGKGPTSGLDDDYVKHRTSASFNCIGGDATIKCSAATINDWMKTIVKLPTVLDFFVADVSQLISDPVKRSNIQQAIQSYVHEKAIKWDNINHCPSCVWGSCTPPANTCQCSSATILGRHCNRCSAGWSGTKCQTPVCNPACVSGSCVAPNKCKCPERHTGAHCESCINGWKTFPACDTPICNNCDPDHGKCVAPEKCECSKKFSGKDCRVPPVKCPHCYGRGKACPFPNTGCAESDKVKCPTCSGDGSVPANLQRCFKCHGHGSQCKDEQADTCSSYNRIKCAGCNKTGTIPLNSAPCTKCKGRGFVDASRNSDTLLDHEDNSTFKTCPMCSGKGFLPLPSHN
eukprot:TRINITY_DN1408_c0_g1_i3.p1 TRINITY_DN1408_c0_g1~~TRINITY_DN1408_c0_g1_i3.p1  ORF type:complete len:736 (-),score=95.11 TRINITY_DN1408_c0_g1_i3:53-2260(-)